MKKIYALMVGEQIIEKSERRNELARKRDEMNNKDAYVCTFIGQFKIINDQVVKESDVFPPSQEEMDELDNQFEKEMEVTNENS